MNRKVVPLLSAVGLAASGSLMALSAASATGPDGAAMAPTVPTRFALQSSGYATQVVKGALPAGSDRSAFQVIGCTNQAGLDKTNSEAAVDAGVLDLDSTRTHVWTTRGPGVVSSYARQTTAAVHVAKVPGVGSLSVTGIVSMSRAFHDATGFHTSTKADVADIVLNPVSGPNVSIRIPARGESVLVPGIARISIGTDTRDISAHSASAELDALQIRLLATGTVVDVAHSRATISDGVTKALYGGSAFVTKVDGLDGSVTSGPTPLLVMPCAGTGDVVRTRAIAKAELGGLAAFGLKTSERAGHNDVRRPAAFMQAEAARVQLGRGLVITGVKARASVEQTSAGLQRSAVGTKTVRVYLRGERLALDARGEVRIPGVARIETRVVERSTNGIRVTAVHVRLLDSRAADIELGVAYVKLTPSGL